MVGMLIDPVTGDLQIKNGSLVFGDNAEQVAESVLCAACGEFKEHPLVGAEIHKLINGNIDPFWCANTTEMLQCVGVPVKRIRINDNQITIE